jgi:hypothetical protein
VSFKLQILFCSGFITVEIIMRSIATLMLSVCIVGAQPSELHIDVLRTLDGQFMKNATVKRMNAVFAIVDFDGGGERIAFTNLPPEVQRQLGFDPAKAQAEIDRQARIKQEAKKRLETQQKAASEAERDRLFRIVDDKVYSVGDFPSIHGKVSQVLSNGVLLVLYEKVAQHISPVHVSGLQSIGGARVVPGGGTYYKDELGDKTVFVKSPIRGKAEGQDWTGCCKRSGTFSYISADGSQRVFEKFDTGVSSVTKSDAVLQQW